MKAIESLYKPYRQANFGLRQVICAGLKNRFVST